MTAACPSELGCSRCADLLAGFIVELRQAGLPVSLTENLDAMEAVKHIPLEDREAFKYALAATLVKNNAPLAGLRDRVRGVLLAAGQAVRASATSDDDALGRAARRARAAGAARRATAGRSGGGGGEPLTPEELAELLYKALLRGDDALLRAVARQAVRRFAGMEPGRPVGGTYYLYRTLRNLDLDGVLDQLMEQARRGPPEPTSRRSRSASSTTSTRPASTS